MMSREELNAVIEQFIESEEICRKSREMYSVLENVMIRKEYFQNVGIARKSDVTPNSSNHRLNKNKSLTKVMSNSDKKFNKLKKDHTLIPENFLLVQRQIDQFESYMNCINQVSDKYSTEFVNLVTVQNRTFLKSKYSNK